MANTVEDIDLQIADLQKKKTDLLNKTRTEALNTVKELIKQYDFSYKEIGIKVRRVGSKSKKVAKFANPDFPEQTWTGQGRQPEWVKGFISLHGSLDKALIN